MEYESEESRILCAAVLSVWTFFVTGPLWLVLLYTVMLHIQATPMLWTFYWLYVISVGLGVFASTLVKLFTSI